tara:strand:+ start:469 stop:663 length:195 start_codon:yes stop_codon:yes gene_type:complete
MDEQRDDILAHKIAKNTRDVEAIIREIENLNHKIADMRLALSDPDEKSIGATHGTVYQWSDYPR